MDVLATKIFDGCSTAVVAKDVDGSWVVLVALVVHGLEHVEDTGRDAQVDGALVACFGAFGRQVDEARGGILAEGKLGPLELVAFMAAHAHQQHEIDIGAALVALGQVQELFDALTG